jgi:hypothetical protein
MVNSKSRIGDPVLRDRTGAPAPAMNPGIAIGLLRRTRFTYHRAKYFS